MTTQLLKDRFEIESQLSCTDFSTVYLACDRKYIHRPHCLITAIPYYQREIRHRLEREAQILERIGRHAQIPSLLTYFYRAEPGSKSEGTFYIVQDRISGHPLSKEIQPDKPLSESYVTKLIHNVLTALAFTHEQGIVHQNLHPEHLIRQASDGQIFLIHFGALSKIARSKIGNDGTLGSSVPVSLHPYAAPEQRSPQAAALANATGPQPASDLYALGLIAIEALTGQKHHAFSYDPIKGLRWREQATVSLPLAEFIDRLVRHEWKDRFSTAKDALQTFEDQTARSRIAEDSRLPTIIAAPGEQLAKPGKTQKGAVAKVSTAHGTTHSPAHGAVALNPYLFRLAIGSLAAVIAIGVGVKTYQWGEYRLSRLPQTWQDWRDSGAPPAADPQMLVPLLADRSILLQPDAAEAFWEMVAAAKAEGIALYPLAGYEKGNGEYATGYAVAIGGAEQSLDKQASFAQAPEFLWLKNNAENYGFEPAFVEDRTLGGSFKQPWYWRYTVNTPKDTQEAALEVK